MDYVAHTTEVFPSGPDNVLAPTEGAKSASPVHGPHVEIHPLEQADIDNLRQAGNSLEE